MNSWCSSDSPTLPQAHIICCGFTHNSSSIAKIWYCYKRETHDIKIPEKQVYHEDTVIFDDLGLACAFFSSAVSLVPHNLYTLILSFILPIYAWRGPQAQQETGQKTGLVASGTTAETTLPLAPSPSDWEDQGSLNPGSPPPP